MRAKVDEGLCAASGNCVSVCPAVFKLDGGVSKVIANPVPKDQEAACRKAAKSCPTGAITVEG